MYRRDSDVKLHAFSDADYAGDEETRRSTTGYCIMLCNAPIAWKSQRQPIITLSTTEAEYVAGCDLVKQIVPIREQLIELGELESSYRTPIYIDNQSPVKISNNEGGQVRTKHIDIRRKWLSEQVANRTIKVDHIRTEDQAADLLTKALHKNKFLRNRALLMSTIVCMSILQLAHSEGKDKIQLKPTSHLTLTPSEEVYIKGDYRYRINNIFVKPCEILFNYSTTLTATETLIKHCLDYYERKVLAPLTNCQRQPTIDPNLHEIPLTYDCSSGLNSMPDKDQQVGRCDVKKREPKQITGINFELDQLNDKWEQHKKAVASVPKLERHKRIVPLLLIGATTTFLSVMVGRQTKAIKVLRDEV